MFMTLVYSVAMEYAVFKIRYNQDYSTKLIEISNGDKIYNFESYQICVKFKCVKFDFFCA